MSRFVDECRREWARLGVPDAEANEMATDLEADLSEAQADGVTPEEVLGNGYFDARSFAMSWATARGFVRRAPMADRTVRIRTLVLGLGALLGAVVAAAGFVILAGSPVGQQVVAAPLARHISRPVPGILVNPHHSLFLSGPGGANLDVLGGVLLAVGLIGLAVILWVWRPWSILRSGSGSDQNVGMPSYL
jgi:hypothetical protein